MKDENLAGMTISDRYHLHQLLGKGGSAHVYLATDTRLQRSVAVKVFQPEGSEKQVFLSHFNREARVLAQLDHRHILPVYDYGEHDDQAYLVMPYMAGGSLRDYLHKHAPLAPEHALSLISQVLDALAYAHDRGLIHRDMKPGNILFKGDGTLMLADFGLAKLLPEADGISLPTDITVTHSVALKGTPDYMAPEQIQGKPGPASDLYAVGIILYEMLTGERPFKAQDVMGMLVQHLQTEPVSPRSLQPTIPPELESVVLRALAKHPEARFKHPNEMLEALHACNLAQSSPPRPHEKGGPLPIPHEENTLAIVTPPTEEPASAPTQISEQTVLAQQTGPEHQVVTPPPISNPGPWPSTPYNIVPQQPSRLERNAKILVIVAVVLLLATIATSAFTIYQARQPLTTTPQTIQSTKQAQSTATSNSTPTSQPTLLPQVVRGTMNCPASGQANAATYPSLSVGSHQRLIYAVNEGTPGNPSAAVIKRRDANDTVKADIIFNTPGAYINEIQVSQDGLWILFVLKLDNQKQLRLLRVDGQIQQTLYCTTGPEDLFGVQWTYDQQRITFMTGSTLKLLEPGSGSIHTLLTLQSGTRYIPATWQDNNHLLLKVPKGGSAPLDLYSLDVRKGENQQESSLKRIASSICSFDPTFDSKRLLISECNTNSGMLAGPSRITVRNLDGSAATTLTSVPVAVTMVRAITAQTLLLLVKDAATPDQNGVWRVNIDGSNLLRLSTDLTGGQTLCEFTQYTWSNLSRDGTFYAIQEHDPNSTNYKMYFGRLDGTDLDYFADISDGTELKMGGWIVF
uniref:non-specific serine/threonine protein kinase n=1 Tax=Thermosporothrix sp. COM3 TaxID=2490863 RepID=A0A455SUN8_9CHLR|nr:hypothetical protein KTC_56320 [Thermosporothrix sp. COM3]